MTISCEVAALPAAGRLFRCVPGSTGAALKHIASLGALILSLAAPSAQAAEQCKTQWTSGMCKLMHVLEIIEARHADAKVADKLVARVMDHLAKEHDPYSNYYDVEAYRELRRGLEGRRSEGASVTSRLLPGGKAYLRIHTFSEVVPQQLVEALEALSVDSSTPISGIVLDLRDNPGGLVRTAVAVAAAFLPRNTLVISTQGDGLEGRQEFRAHPGDYLDIAEDDYFEHLPARFRSLPMTVLVNRGSASASEILAASLQDHRRAAIIGTRTYGKGTVQTIIPLEDDTAIKFTTSFFYTPKGRKVDGNGVTPDVVIKRKAESVKTDAAEGQVATVAVCALKGGADSSLADVRKLAGEDQTDCQLQQALVSLGAQRMAQVR